MAIIYSLFNLMPNLITAVYFFIKYKIKLSSGCKVGFVFIVKGNFNYFLSNFSITLYTTYYQVLLGLLSPMYLPAYALSDKIVRSVISANYIFIQIIQVYFLKLNANITKRNFFLILTFLVSVALVETIFLMCFALWGGEKFFGNIIMLKDFLILMTAIIPIVILSNFWGMVYLPCTGNIGSLSKIFIKVSMLSLVLSPLLVYLFHGYGAIFSSVLSESLVLIMCFFVSKNIIKEREFR
ncbi:hypothetical protein [Pectobacterium cacticida]|uniref:hypothetical protein n=1 Tax=Pectobacterium cacticida TaxID=69221 RepID=UPI0035E67CF5